MNPARLQLRVIHVMFCRGGTAFYFPWSPEPDANSRRWDASKRVGEIERRLASLIDELFEKLFGHLTNGVGLDGHQGPRA